FRNLHVGQIRSELFTRLTEELAVNHGDRRKNRRRYVGEVRRVLDGRLGVPVPLDDDALGLIVVEVGVVLQRSGVLGPHDLHRLSGQALELLELALVELEPSDTQKLTHGSHLQTLRCWPRSTSLGWPSECPPDHDDPHCRRALSRPRRRLVGMVEEATDSPTRLPLRLLRILAYLRDKRGHCGP